MHPWIWRAIHLSGKSRVTTAAFPWALLATIGVLYGIQVATRVDSQIFISSARLTAVNEEVVKDLVSKLLVLQDQVAAQQLELQKLHGNIASRKEVDAELGKLQQLRNETSQLIGQERVALRHIVEEHSRGLKSDERALEHAQMLLENHNKENFRKQPQLSHKLLTSGDPADWRQRTFQHYNGYGFVKYSAYRVDPMHISVVALAALRLRPYRRLGPCLWHDKVGEPINGTISFLYMEEHHNLEYEVVILKCTLESAIEDSSKGGYLEGTVDEERMILYREDEPPEATPSSPYKYKMAYCGPRMYGSLNPERLRNWFDNVRTVLNADYFFLYDMGPVDDAVRAAIKPYIDAEMVDITDFREGLEYNVWTRADGLALNDCLYRTRHLAHWVFVHDVDEYIQVVPPHTLRSLLTQYADRPWLTHQVMWWNLERCSRKPLPGEWGPEVMIFLDPSPYCFSNPGYTDLNYCLGWHGHRKYLYQPRMVEVVAIHQVVIPEMGGVDLHRLTEVHHHHYQGLARGNNNMTCSHIIPDGDPVDWWVRDRSNAERICEVKQCAFHNASCRAELPD